MDSTWRRMRHGDRNRIRDDPNAHFQQSEDQKEFYGKAVYLF